jgi:hypothetical protein
MDTVGYVLRGEKWQELETDQSPSFITKVQNMWIITSTALIHLHGVVL